MDISVNKAKPPRPHRIRRTPDQARQLILDAAEACMGAEGPAGLRLTQVAARAGVSHPTLLHHFGSREALVAAVHRRAVESMRDRLGAMMQAPGGTSRTIVQTVFAAYRDGIAERLVWILQSGIAIGPARDGQPVFAGMVEGLHALRRQIAPPDHPPDERDTRFIIHMIAVAAFGDALIGSRLRMPPGASGPDDDATRDAFERWFSAIVDTCVAPWAAPATDLR